MKRYLLLLVLPVLFSCRKEAAIKTENGAVVMDSVKAPEKANNPEKINTIFLLVPGSSAGIIAIGQPADSLAVLGKPDLWDAAMGKAWSTWISEHGTAREELNVYTTYKDDEMASKVVKLVRVTSPEYKTADSLGSGNTLDGLRKKFPDLKLSAKYKRETDKKEITLYDATAAGIAFETEDKAGIPTCIAVIIHEKNRKVTDTYITFHPEMVRL